MEQWKEEDESEMAKEQAKKHIKEARAAEIKNYNEKIIQLRKEEEEREKIIDKALLQDILKREQEIKQAEEEERLKIREETTKMQNMFDNKGEILRREER